MRDNVARILEERQQLGSAATPREPLDTTIDRIHFYVSYHGLNDRALQEMVVRAYHAHIVDLNFTSAHLTPQIGDSSKRGVNVAAAQPVRKVRVGFLSKFLGIFEPHGLLLDGVMRYLPRTHFYVLALPVARTDGKPMSADIVEAADEVSEISLTYTHASAALNALELDILVIADSMSEPMTHFLVHNRFAKIQVCMCCFYL